MPCILWYNYNVIKGAFVEMAARKLKSLNAQGVHNRSHFVCF